MPFAEVHGRPIYLMPSILSADFARLGEEARAAEAAGADGIQIDVMDGVFVPNISVGLPVVASLRRTVNFVLDCHLMITQPERYIADFVKAGANHITVHAEATLHLHRTIQQIKELGVRAGVTLNPATPLAALDEILPAVDQVLIMSVNPGFGGQSYIPESTERIARLRRRLDERGLGRVELEVDGGIKTDNAAEVRAAGATILVIGSAIFNRQASVAENIAALRRAAG